MTLIVTVVLASLVVSFLCSLCEASLYAVTPTQVEVLRRLMAERQYLAVVTDAVGHVVGVATLEDVLENLLGKPIVGEHDSHPEMQRMARERARVRDSAEGT